MHDDARRARRPVHRKGPVVDVLLEADVAVQFHTGLENPYRSSNHAASWRSPEEMGNFMATWPDLKVILAHSGPTSGIPDGYEALRLLLSFDNCNLYISKSVPDIVGEAVRGAGAERVLFGTDWIHPGMPSYGPYHMSTVHTYWYDLNNVALANITKHQRDRILYKTRTETLEASCVDVKPLGEQALGRNVPGACLLDQLQHGSITHTRPA